MKDVVHPTLDESYFVSNFISGLNEELRPIVKMMQPTPISQAAEKAKLQEWALEAIFKKHRMVSKGLNTSSPLLGSGGVFKAANSGPQKGNMMAKTAPNPAPVKSPSMEQKRQLGLCFHCGEKYGLGHQCRRQLLQMEGLEGDEGEVEAAGEMEAAGEDGEISFHALQGSPSGKIIKVKG